MNEEVKGDDLHDEYEINGYDKESPPPVHIKSESIDLKPSDIPAVKEELNHHDNSLLSISSYNDDSSKCGFLSPCKNLASSSQCFPVIVKEEHVQVFPDVKVEVENEIDEANYTCSVCHMHFINQRVYNMHFNLSHPAPPRTCTQMNNGTRPKSAKSSTRRFSVQTIKKLIECVRNNPCLYNTDNENYNNEDLKMLTWTTIASECDLPSGTIAKTEWKNLITRLINSLTVSGQGSSSRVQKSWQYKKQMEFVLPYITENDIHSLQRIQRANDAAAVAANYHNERAKRKRLDTAETSTSTSDGQPLDMFFLSMCATTKNLPSYVQLQVKKKIFNAVIEAEEIVAAMHNDQANASAGAAHDAAEYQNNLSPYSVQSNADDDWQDD